MSDVKYVSSGKSYESILTRLLPHDWFDVSWLIGAESGAWSKEDQTIFSTCATWMRNVVLREAHLAALQGLEALQGALQGVVNGWLSQPFRQSVVFYQGQ